MNTSSIEDSLIKMASSIMSDSFIYDLLLAYDFPKSTIARIKNGDLNLSKNPNEVLLKKKVLFRKIVSEDPHDLIDSLSSDPATTKNAPRFVIVTDFITFLALDTKTRDTLDIPIEQLAKNYDFFLPWIGKEKAQIQTESVVDVKAAARMGLLYDIIIEDNPKLNETSEGKHQLNIFLSRLLFCFFAEDTELFNSSQFSNTISLHTSPTGSDLKLFIERLFTALNTKDRSNLPNFLQAFPYVNGGLFSESIPAPNFSARSRKIIIESGALDWSSIHPDIFGSMLQAVAHTDQRAEMGQHYTSVPNIMKVIEPLFLDELYDAFENSNNSLIKLEHLLLRLENIKLFDPACGSGNFLIIAYKEIRILEMKILQRIHQISKNKAARFSNIQLSQFFGIEIDDFSHELAILSLWLTEHQMNVKFKEIFGAANPLLPLKKGGNIVCGNALTLDWLSVCPKNENSSVFLLGNPPYKGSRNQEKHHKAEMQKVIRDDYKSLDYVACWFFKGSEYIRQQSGKFAFVSTNSICQGEQVALLWPKVLKEDLEIFFAHKSFKWANNAKNNAGVTCVIVGIATKNSAKKRIFDGNQYLSVNSINGYLTSSSISYISRRSTPLSSFLPKIVYGNLLNDGGNLTLDKQELNVILNKHPNAKRFIRKFVGSQEFIKGYERWCLKIEDDELEDAMQISLIKERLERVRVHRAKSTEKSTREMAKFPHRYYFSSYENTTSIIIPRTSSERRAYIPIGFLSSDYVISDAAQAIYGAEPYVLGIISSKIHMVWMRAVAGRLETRYRYSSAIVYNNFPMPLISDNQKKILTTHVLQVLHIREKHPEKTLSELYDPDKMPSDLLTAHQELDLAVEQCYRLKPFISDEERLECLFKLYEELSTNEKRH